MSRFLNPIALILFAILAACVPAPTSPSTPQPPLPSPSRGGAGGEVREVAPTVQAPQELKFSKNGYTTLGEWSAQATLNSARWLPGDSISLNAKLRITDAHLAAANAKAKVDGMVMLITAERTFDSDGWLRFAAAEKMSTLVTPTGLAIEGGVQGPVSKRIGYQFRTPVEEFISVPIASAQKTENGEEFAFSALTKLPDDLPPGIYRLRLDFGASANKRFYSLNGDTFGRRPFSQGKDCESEMYSPPILANGRHVSGKFVDASGIKPRIPWVILGNYNSNGYRGVVAEEDKSRFALSNRNIIPDDVILPFYDDANKSVSYSLEPQFPFDTIDSRVNIPWDYTKGELTIQVMGPDGKTTDLGTAPYIAKQGQWHTTKQSKFTAWKPPSYGQYTVRATGWVADAWGNRYEGGGTYKFWIAKRMTLATATFQGQAYPVGNRYGRDIGFSPAVPADVQVTATLYVNSDPKNAKTISFKGKASPGGMFTAAQGLQALPFDAPGEYHAQVLATYTDAEGHLWVASMRHAGVVYPVDTPIVAHGKKVSIKGKLFDRGETNAEGWIDTEKNEQHLEHINFPYNAGDVLLIASEMQGANKIEPVLTYEMKTNPAPYDPALQTIGATNVRIQTSNGYSPHLFPEYITEFSYYYAAGPRPGLMSRFLVAEDGTRAPYWPTSTSNFGGQINASNNGDQPGDIYRLIGGVVVRKKDQAPMYAGYIANAFILSKGSKNNRVIAPGSEDIVGSTGEKARAFIAMNARPGMVYETGTAFVPALQIDPMIPLNVAFTLNYPDGRQVVAQGVADASGSFAGKDRWVLDVPGVYRYTIDSDWNGFRALTPGLPNEGGAIYVIEKERPTAQGLKLNMPEQSNFSPTAGLKITGTSSAKVVNYAAVIPGAIIAGGEISVKNGKFEFFFNPAEINKTAPTYEIINMVNGKPEIRDVVHLTFFAQETTPTTFHSYVRVILRGTTALYVR